MNNETICEKMRACFMVLVEAEDMRDAIGDTDGTIHATITTVKTIIDTLDDQLDY